MKRFRGLERAVEARRARPRHFRTTTWAAPISGKELYGQAIACFQEALNVEATVTRWPRQALASLRRMVN